MTFLTIYCLYAFAIYTFTNHMFFDLYFELRKLFYLYLLLNKT